MRDDADETDTLEVEVQVGTRPLPFNYRRDADGTIREYGYNHDQKASEWRMPLKDLGTRTEAPPPPGLFDEGLLNMGQFLLEPDELINPAPLVGEDKRAAAAEKRVEAARRKALSDEEKAAEQRQEERQKLVKKRDLNELGLVVRVARHSCGYGIKFKLPTAAEVTAVPEHIAAVGGVSMLDTANALIQKLLPDCDLLTADEFIMHVFNGVDLVGDTYKYYKSAASALANYQRQVKDFVDLLNIEEEGTRFSMLVARIASRSFSRRRVDHPRAARWMSTT